MCWYILRTRPSQEEKNQQLIQIIFRDLEIIFPKRRLSWRKKGQIIDIIEPLFRGYLFVTTTNERIEELDLWLRVNRIEAQLMKTDKKISQITSEEADLISKLMCNGDIVEKSEIKKIGERVSIVSGPLVGLEGIIERFSKRNRRVTVRITIGGEVKRVDLEGKWLNLE
ncbi:MAG: antitermination protein NusG [Clostridia bacterium]|nr:antitermination protein NusG [Clostridia bacterium]